MADLRPIPTPLGQHWRRIRYQMLPVVIFGVALASTFWLWGRQSGLTHAIGEVEVTRLELTAPADGTLVPLPGKTWEQFQFVKKGDVLARMDDRAAIAALSIIQGSIGVLQKELIAAELKTRQDLAELARDRIDRENDAIAGLRRMALDIERLELNILDREAAIQADGLEYNRRNERFKAIEELAQKGVETQYRLWDFRLARDQAKERKEGNERVLAEAKAQLKRAKQRQVTLRESLSTGPTTHPAADIETFLAPMRAAIAVERAKLGQARLLAESLEIRATFDGMIRDIYRFPGQTVRMGDPILTVVADQAPYLITYVRQHHRVGPEVGMAVDVRVRSLPVRTVKGHIAEIGPQVVRVPRQHQRDPQTAEWGLPVRIVTPASAGLQPGEMVDVTFHRPKLHGP